MQRGKPAQQAHTREEEEEDEEDDSDGGDTMRVSFSTKPSLLLLWISVAAPLFSVCPSEC